MHKGISDDQFNQYFQDEEHCLKYLASLKWDNGYICKKCGSEKWWKGRLAYDRRCQKCGYNESPTAGTLFHKLKFNLLTAFKICFKISVRKKGMSSCELSREYGIRQTTAWYFKRKIQQAMKSSGKYPLQDQVEVDEFVVGQKESGNQGRAKGSRKIVLLAVEKVSANKKIGRAYAESIADYSIEELQPFFEKNIDNQCRVITDGWTSYQPLKEIYPRLKQKESAEGKNFARLHIHIMNLKGWLRGIHHHCSEKYMQGYLDEFHFRFNRRAHLSTIFDKLLERMVKSSPLYLSQRELTG